MAYTQAQVDALENAIATGAMRVRVGDRDTMFRSLEEMKSLLAEMKAEVAGTTPIRHIRVKTNKGFDC